MADKSKDISMLLKGYDKQHDKQVKAQQKIVDGIFSSLVKSSAKAGEKSGYKPEDKEFYFKDFPATEKDIDKMIADMVFKVDNTIKEGSKSEWEMAEKKNNDLVDILSKGANVSKQQKEEWQSGNPDALKAFQERKVNGMNLSQRVWNLGQQTKSQLELAIETGLNEGKSADELARDVKKYLKEPNRLYHKVRDKNGNLRLSKNAAAYHPGQGVYRSSYKNALRLTATEINMAYRTADYEKWQKMSCVIGIEIHLSNNHTLNGAPFTDICNDMVGKYPKDFKFVGWHPFCRCFATPILADMDEQNEVMLKEMNGEDVSGYHYKGEVTEMPKGFENWIESNALRIQNAKSVPYFIKDNYKNGDIEKGLKWVKGKPTAEQQRIDTIKQYKQKISSITDAKELRELRKSYEGDDPEVRKAFIDQAAEIRHANRNDEQIKQSFKEYKEKIAAMTQDAKDTWVEALDYPYINADKLNDLIKKHRTSDLLAETQNIKEQIKEIEKWEKGIGDNIPDVKYWETKFSKEQLQSVNDAVEKKLQSIEDKWNNDTYLNAHYTLDEYKLKKLKYEAYDYLGGNIGDVQSKYATWEVSQASYIKHIDKVEFKIQTKQVQDDIDTLKAAVKKLKAGHGTTIYKSTINAENYLKTGDLANAKDEIQKAQQAQMTLEAKRAKKAAANRSTDSDVGKAEAYTQARKDAAVWAKDGMTAYKELGYQTTREWATATKAEKSAIYEYTREYNNINEPLRGLTYIGSPEKTKRGLDRIPEITNLLKRTHLDHDMWFQRGDNMVALKKFGLSNFDYATDSEIKALVGKEGTEGAFWSAGTSKGDGFSHKPVILNIYAPKGTKGMYVEPFSDFGAGACSPNWDGSLNQNYTGSENEYLIQRGTKFRITKVEKRGNGGWFVDVDIIGQDIVEFPYKGGYPFK